MVYFEPLYRYIPGFVEKKKSLNCPKQKNNGYQKYVLL